MNLIWAQYKYDQLYFSKVSSVNYKVHKRKNMYPGKIWKIKAMFR